MAYSCPRDLDGFAPHLSKPDTRFRQQLGQDLLTFLAEPANTIACQDIGQFIDGLVPWTHSSNFKVSSLGIEILTFLADRLGHDFRPYLQTVLPAILDRLGDAKDSVREKSQLFILKLLERNVLSPQTLFEKLSSGFTHKNARIREEVLRCLVNTLNEHGAHSLTLSKFIPDIVNLLSDPTSSVRDTAFSTLVDLYKHVGEKLRVDLQKRNLVPQAKWPALAARFEEVKNNEELLPTATKNIELNFDEVDRMAKAPLSVKKSAYTLSASKPKSGLATPNAVLSRVGSLRKLTLPSASGAVDEELFLRSFEDVPNVQIFSPRDVTDQFKNIQDTISDTNKDWNKRVEALKKIRSVVIAGATQSEDFYVCLKNLDISLQGSLKDLRSQVVREACITIAYLSQTIGNKFEKMAEMLLQHLINLIQNSAKIMSTSGEVTVRFIIKYIHYFRLIPIITSNATTSKSKEIRRACCEFVEIMLSHWPTHPLERHVALLQECVKKGIADADPEARVSSRKAFRGFRDHFPDQAEALLQSLEPSYRRALQGDGMSASSSNNNLNSCFKTPRQYGKTAPQSASDSANKKGFRSNSAIDLQAAQRAKARAQYSAMARNKIHSGTASLQGEVHSARPKRSPEVIATASPERVSRTRSRSSQSQPTSRSGSPSSRLAYLYNRSTEHDSPRPRKLSSGIPRSTQGSRDTSRETSPSRGTGLSRFRRGTDRPPLSPASRPVLAQKILQQSREAETALADAFNDSGETLYRSPRKSMRSLDNHSDESETSSVCSERSYDSFKRPSDEQQDIASNIVHNHMRKTSTSSEPSSPMISGSPKPLSPGTPPFGDQEEVYKSLRRTTAEIQNYSFETLGRSRPKLDRDRDTTSQDSGISQMSVGNDIKNDICIIEEKMEELRPFNVRSGPRSLPYTSVNGITETDSNGCRSLGDIKDSDAVIKEVIERCCIDHITPIAEKRRLLNQVLDLIRQGHVQSVLVNFKKLLRIFIDHLESKDPQNQVIVLKILAAIFQNSTMKDTWQNFVELITLKVLKAHSSERREVVKEAETTAAAMAVCPFDTVVYTLAPLIRTSPYPEDLGAIKMLTKLIEANPQQITDDHLLQVMPGILKGTDHNESPVRKSSIFCMVALYKAVGEERFAIYINLLTGSKVKLLRLYISRSEQNNSMPTSPKNSSTSTPKT
ncbi:CLIP-associating protein 1-B isoform X8 [Sitophilus oryzae]|uniref:CLIP-associating protein 1-B isoform X8 n=1 Tax=Sitophilus oryzae TaxID=7048 RepID=A0A6J2YH01_SITOR|nr:CLIP-associating protein 1-B isoform X8 [Sitophilus oryzae]